MRKRILITCIMIVCLCCAMIPQALTQDPITCEELQAQVQALVGNEADGDWKSINTWNRAKSIRYAPLAL